MDVITSRYKIEDFADGFKVYGENRTPAYVYFTGYGFYPTCTESCQIYNSLGLFELYKLIDSISQTLMREWKPPTDKVQSYTSRGKKYPSWPLHKWAVTQTGKGLAKRIKAKWLECLAKATPQTVAVQRAYFAACGKHNPALSDSRLYNEANKFMMSDIINYKAAALATNDINLNSDNLCWYRNYIGSGMRYVSNNWMDVYTPKEGVNTSLRKTLTKLPGGIPYHILKNLSRKVMTRPIYTRLELLAYLHLASYPAIDYRHVLEKSNRDDILKACKIVQASLRQKGSLRKSKTINECLSYIYDCAETHYGNIVGLAHKSVRWHREHRYNDLKKYCEFPENTSTLKPAIALPTDKRIKFLDTVGEIFAEGTEMAHCVCSYAGGAVSGHCFLFHVDYNGEAATVEISPNGEVVQSRGPHNQKNKATRWAERKLTEWGQSLSDKVVQHPNNNNITVDIPF